MAQKKKRKAKRRAPKREPVVPLDELLEIGPQAVDGAIAEAAQHGPEGTQRMINTLVNQVALRLAQLHQLPPERVLLVIGTDATTRLLHAIEACSEKQAKSHDEIADQLILALGPDAIEFLRN